MQRPRFTPARFAALASTVVLLLTGCSRGDVGAPCNHGQIEPPESKLVTFPALSCNELLCVYGDEEEAPETPCEVGSNDCNSADETRNRFECVPPAGGGDTGTCRLRVEYVLSRSMCSRQCSSDDDCKDGGVGQRVVVEETECDNGFRCAIIQSLGEFCCQKLCVCADDLAQATADELARDCAMGEVPGCCDVEDDEPLPDGCGRRG